MNEEKCEGITFGPWLRARRRSLDLTQEDLGRRLGYSADMIRKIELGARKPSRQLAGLLADWMKVPDGKRRRFMVFARGGEERRRSRRQSQAPQGGQE